MRLASLLTLIVIALLALPAATVLRDTALGDESSRFASLDGREWTLLARSLWVATLATLMALPMGISTALLAVSLPPRRGRWIEWLSYVPILLPNIILVLGWIYFAGVSSPLAGALAAIGIDAGSWLYGPAGVAFVLALASFPCVTLFCIRSFRQVDAAALESARVYGTGTQATLLLIRSASRSLWTASTLVFLLAFADFGVPSALMVNVFPVEVFVQLNAFLNHDRALTILSVPIVIALLVGVIRPRLPAAQVSGYDHWKPIPIPRSVTTVAVGTLLSALAVPATFLVRTAGSPSSYLQSLRIAGDQFLNSQTVALWSLVVVMPVALCLIFLLRRSTRRGQRWAETGLLVLLVLPGGATGLGLLSMAGGSQHISLLAVAVACRYMAFPVFLLLLAAPPLDDPRLHAARLAGASPARVVTRIFAPMIAPALVTAASVVAVLSMGELSAAVLLNPPGAMTLPVRLSSLLHFGEPTVVAALCVILSAFIVGILALARLLADLRGASR